MHTFFGKWITDARFLALEPINVYHKQSDTSFVWEHPEELKNVHMLVRGDITLDPSDADAIRLYFSADDFCKIRINGKTVAYGPAQGYFFHYYYNCIDIKPYLAKGQNRIEAEVLYQGVINRYTNNLGETFNYTVKEDASVALSTDGYTFGTLDELCGA